MNIGYLTNFIVYAFAMSGVMLIAVSIYKRVCGLPANKQAGKLLSVQDKLIIAPRKTLYVVKAGEEYFLVAGDTERTTMLSKLNPSKQQGANILPQVTPSKSFESEDIHITNKRILQKINERLERKEEDSWITY